MLALDGADHEVGFAERRRVTVFDRHIGRRASLPSAVPRASLSSAGVDGDHAARGVVARSCRSSPALCGAQPRGRSPIGLAKANSAITRGDSDMQMLS